MSYNPLRLERDSLRVKPQKRPPMKRTIFLYLLLSAALAASLVPGSARAAAGDLYVASASEGAVFRFAPDGTKSTFASGLNTPVALAFDRQGNLFVADPASCVSGDGLGCGQPSIIFRFTPSGEKSTFASVASNQLLGMALDSSANLFVSDGSAILKFTPEGTRSTFASKNNISGLAFDTSGNLFAADFFNRILFRFTPEGTESTFASGLDGPAGLAFDRHGDLFVADRTAIRKFTPGGVGSSFASEVNSHGLAFDGRGDLFAADEIQDEIFRFTPDGTKTTFASEVNFPMAVAFEPIPEKLLNTSARGSVQTGDNVLIGGFILGGNALANNAVVVRAIGPSLSASGIANPLNDPTLELRNASGAIIASNDNWQDTQAAQITASGLAPSDSRESAILATLPAGNFTAIVRGVSNTTGVALVEVYSSR